MSTSNRCLFQFFVPVKFIVYSKKRLKVENEKVPSKHNKYYIYMYLQMYDVLAVWHLHPHCEWLFDFFPKSLKFTIIKNK